MIVFLLIVILFILAPWLFVVALEAIGFLAAVGIFVVLLIMSGVLA